MEGKRKLLVETYAQQLLLHERKKKGERTEPYCHNRVLVLKCPGQSVGS